MPPEISRRLYQGQPPVDEVQPNESLGRPDLHAAPHREACPAGTDIGYAAVIEREPCISDVFLPAEDRYAQSLHRAYACPGQREQDIEVVNHQIQNDADVERPAGESPEPLAFNELRLERELLQ